MKVWMLLLCTLVFATFDCLPAPPNSMIDASKSSEMLDNTGKNVRQKRHHHFGHGFGDHYGHGYGYGYGQYPYQYGQYPYEYGHGWPDPYHHW